MPETNLRIWSPKRWHSLRARASPVHCERKKYFMSRQARRDERRGQSGGDYHTGTRGVLHAWVLQDCSLLLTRYIPRPCSRLLHVTPRPHNPTSLAKHERAAAAPTTVMLSLALLTADLPARAVVTCEYRARTAVLCVSVMEFNRKNISHVLVAIVRARQGTMWLCALSVEKMFKARMNCVASQSRTRSSLTALNTWSHSS